MKQQFYFLRSADSFEDKVKGLHPPKEIRKVDKEDNNELSKHDGLLGLPEVNQKRVRFQQTDSLNVIVEIQSLDERSSSNEPEEFQDDGVKMIDQENDGNQPGRTDQSVSQEFPNDLPPWKRQVLFNRKLKEKAMEKAQREKVDLYHTVQKFLSAHPSRFSKQLLLEKKSKFLHGSVEHKARVDELRMLENRKTLSRVTRGTHV